mgnify:CR=1 FL=1
MRTLEEIEKLRRALEAKGYRVVVEGNTLTATRDGELHRIKVEGGAVHLETERPSMDLVEAVLYG